MANSQDVLDMPSGQRGGEALGFYGGNAGKDPAGFSEGQLAQYGYTAGFDYDEYGIPTPRDKGAFFAALNAAKADPNNQSARAQDVTRFRNMGELAGNRSAPWIDYTQANGYLGSANDQLANSAAARGDQTQALGLMRDAAYGNAPSRAELLGRSMIDQSLSAQQASAASARGGPMAQAAAQRDAASNAAAFRQQGLGQLAAMRAGEMADSRNAYMAGASGMRAQDFTGANAYGSLGQIAGQQAQAQAQAELQQRQMNDQAQMGYEQLGFNVNQAALNANLGRMSQEQQGMQFGKQMDMTQRGQDMDMMAAGISAGSTFGAAAMKADGGPVAAGRPYIVGERGPELIVPSQGGTVIPAEQTPQVLALYEPPGQRLQMSDTGHAYLASAAEADDGRPRLTARATDRRPQLAQAAAQMTAARMQAPQRRREMTPDELRAAADRMEREQRAAHQANMSAGPAVRVPVDLGDVDAPGFMTPSRGPTTMATYFASPRPATLPSYSGLMTYERLYGGREDPYGEAPPPRLIGGREDPYQ